MKKTFILSLAVAALAFISCSEDNAESPVPAGRMVEMTVTASSVLESSGPDSRTVYNPGTKTIDWGYG